MELKDLALEELKMLEDIISRQDQFKDKTKNLAVTLLTAVSVGYFSGQVPLSQGRYLFAAAGICAVFVLLEGIYGITEINAEARCEKVENFLRDDSNVYHGPAISLSLVHPPTPGL